MVSTIASIICIIGLVYVNNLLALEYQHSSGKDQALFGLTELIRIERKLYFIPFGIISLVCCIIAISKNERITNILVSSLLTIISIILFFLRIWEYMV